MCVKRLNLSGGPENTDVATTDNNSLRRFSSGSARVDRREVFRKPARWTQPCERRRGIPPSADRASEEPEPTPRRQIIRPDDADNSVRVLRGRWQGTTVDQAPCAYPRGRRSMHCRLRRKADKAPLPCWQAFRSSAQGDPASAGEAERSIATKTAGLRVSTLQFARRSARVGAQLRVPKVAGMVFPPLMMTPTCALAAGR